MQLHARRQKQRNSARETRRAQRGGAKWEEMYGVDTIIDTRLAKWKSHLETSELFKGLLIKVLPATTDPTYEEIRKQKLEAWLNAIMYQEDLFTIAFKLYDVSGADADSELQYFKDVVRFCNFGYTKPDSTTAAQTKISKLLDHTSGIDNENIALANVNLFGDAFTNSFIYSLALIIKMLKENPTQLKPTGDPFNAALARYLTSIIRSNAWLYTGLDMYDGFFLDQAKQNFSVFIGTKDTFTHGFLESLNDFLKGDISTLPTKVNTLIESIATAGYGGWYQKIWYTLAALIAYLHIKGDVKDVLKLIQGATYNRSDSDTDLFGRFYNQPDKELQNFSLSSTNKLNIYQLMRKLTVGKIVTTTKRGGGVVEDTSNHISGADILHYIIHLAKRVAEYSNTTKDAEGNLVPTFTAISASKFFTSP